MNLEKKAVNYIIGVAGAILGAIVLGSLKTRKKNSLNTDIDVEKMKAQKDALVDEPFGKIRHRNEINDLNNNIMDCYNNKQ